MDLLTAKAKWAVLEKISKKEVSPIEIAKQLDTTVANVSTQLRYLELANVVKKRKVSNVEAGKPRVLYSMQRSLFIVMAAAPGFHMRRVLEMDAQKETILRIWSLPKVTHGPLLALYVKNPQLFSSAHDLYFADHGDTVIKLIASNTKKDLPPKILTVTHDGKQVAIDVRFVNVENLGEYKRLTLIHKGEW